MVDVPSVEELDALSTDELRRRAFERAERRHDIGFFWDLLRHLPAAETVASEDGSLGNITGGIAEVIEVVNELFGKDLGDAEPLIRARFIDYLRRPE
jgi:hypothetical protein